MGKMVQNCYSQWVNWDHVVMVSVTEKSVLTAERLTNGRCKRLYWRISSLTLDMPYQIDKDENPFDDEEEIALGKAQTMQFLDVVDIWTFADESEIKVEEHHLQFMHMMAVEYICKTEDRYVFYRDLDKYVCDKFEEKFGPKNALSPPDAHLEA